MKKETIIAIILGLGLGAAVAVFLIFQTEQKKIENTKTIANNLKITPTSVQAKNNQNFQPLEIVSPEDMNITGKDSITIKGKAVKNSLVVIQSQTKVITFENGKEDFSVNFPLILGENVINITAYNKKLQLEPQTKELKIYYLDEQ